VKGNYHVIDGKGKGAERTLAAFCRANGQILLPLVELVEQARLALDTVVEQVSQQTIETILQLSAEQIAGPRTPGRSRGEIRWYGSQAGRVSLADVQQFSLTHRLGQIGGDAQLTAALRVPALAGGT
jgi:hypothetical protein